jgi:hypothetical protein
MLFPANDDPAVMVLPECGETAMIAIMITIHHDMAVTVAVVIPIARMTVAVLVTIADTHLDLRQLHVAIRDRGRAGERRRSDHTGCGGKNQSKLFHYDSPRGPLFEDDLRFDDLTWTNARETDWLQHRAINANLREFGSAITFLGSARLDELFAEPAGALSPRRRISSRARSKL